MEANPSDPKEERDSDQTRLFDTYFKATVEALSNSDANARQKPDFLNSVRVKEALSQIWETATYTKGETEIEYSEFAFLVTAYYKGLRKWLPSILAVSLSTYRNTQKQGTPTDTTPQLEPVVKTLTPIALQKLRQDCPTLAGTIWGVLGANKRDTVFVTKEVFVNEFAPAVGSMLMKLTRQATVQAVSEQKLTASELSNALGMEDKSTRMSTLLGRSSSSDVVANNSERDVPNSINNHNKASQQGTNSSRSGSSNSIHSTSHHSHTTTHSSGRSTPNTTHTTSGLSNNTDAVALAGDNTDSTNKGVNPHTNATNNNNSGSSSRISENHKNSAQPEESGGSGTEEDKDSVAISESASLQQIVHQQQPHKQLSRSGSSNIGATQPVSVERDKASIPSMPSTVDRTVPPTPPTTTPNSSVSNQDKSKTGPHSQTLRTLVGLLTPAAGLQRFLRPPTVYECVTGQRSEDDHPTSAKSTTNTETLSSVVVQAAEAMFGLLCSAGLHATDWCSVRVQRDGAENSGKEGFTLYYSARLGLCSLTAPPECDPSHISELTIDYKAQKEYLNRRIKGDSDVCALEALYSKHTVWEHLLRHFSTKVETEGEHTPPLTSLIPDTLKPHPTATAAGWLQFTEADGKVNYFHSKKCITCQQRPSGIRSGEELLNKLPRLAELARFMQAVVIGSVTPDDAEASGAVRARLAGLGMDPSVDPLSVVLNRRTLVAKRRERFFSRQLRVWWVSPPEQYTRIPPSPTTRGKSSTDESKDRSASTSRSSSMSTSKETTTTATGGSNKPIMYQQPLDYTSRQQYSSPPSSGSGARGGGGSDDYVQQQGIQVEYQDYNSKSTRGSHSSSGTGIRGIPQPHYVLDRKHKKGINELSGAIIKSPPKLPSDSMLDPPIIPPPPHPMARPPSTTSSTGDTFCVGPAEATSAYATMAAVANPPPASHFVENFVLPSTSSIHPHQHQSGMIHPSQHHIGLSSRNSPPNRSIHPPIRPPPPPPEDFHTPHTPHTLSLNSQRSKIPDFNLTRSSSPPPPSASLFSSAGAATPTTYSSRDSPTPAHVYSSANMVVTNMSNASYFMHTIGSDGRTNTPPATSFTPVSAITDNTWQPTATGNSTPIPTSTAKHLKTHPNWEVHPPHLVSPNGTEEENGTPTGSPVHQHSQQQHQQPFWGHPMVGEGPPSSGPNTSGRVSVTSITINEDRRILRRRSPSPPPPSSSSHLSHPTHSSHSHTPRILPPQPAPTPPPTTHHDINTDHRSLNPQILGHQYNNNHLSGGGEYHSGWGGVGGGGTHYDSGGRRAVGTHRDHTPLQSRPHVNSHYNTQQHWSTFDDRPDLNMSMASTHNPQSPLRFDYPLSPMSTSSPGSLPPPPASVMGNPRNFGTPVDRQRPRANSGGAGGVGMNMNNTRPVCGSRGYDTNSSNATPVYVHPVHGNITPQLPRPTSPFRPISPSSHPSTATTQQSSTHHHTHYSRKIASGISPPPRRPPPLPEHHQQHQPQYDYGGYEQLSTVNVNNNSGHPQSAGGMGYSRTGSPSYRAQHYGDSSGVARNNIICF